jgi:hypothetical protein
MFRLALNLRLFILGWSLAIVFVGSAKAGDPDPNQVPEFALDEKLRAVHRKGSELYNGGDKKGCVKYYVAELTQVHSALGDFPELQNTITKGIKKAGGSATVEDEAFALLDVIIQLRKELQDLDAAAFLRMGDKAWASGQSDRAGRFYLRAVNASALKKDLPKDALATHQAALSAIFAGPGPVKKTEPAPANIKVQDDPKGNGWDVSVSFRKDPPTFARAAQAWTLDHAKELAERIRKENAGVREDLSVAEIQIKGKDGDGEVKADQGPQLPDWPVIEQRFRARTQAKPEQFEPQLKDLKAAYQQAADQAEQVMRAGKPATADQQQALDQLFRQYNSKLAELEKALGGPQPLPQFNLTGEPRWEDHRPGWAETKRVQYDLEKLGQQTTAKQADLQGEQNKLLTEWKKVFGDRLAKKDTETLVFREETLKNKTDLFGQQAKAVTNDRTVLDQLRAAVGNQFGALQGQVLDSNRIAPSADQFTTRPGGAVYKSVPQVQVFKTDDKGKPLPEDQQPPGYPKALDRAVALLKGEKAFVDPSLKVELLPEQPAQTKAGVYGRVAKVDPAAGTVTLDVDNKGTQLVFSGIEPRGIAAGDEVDPQRVIGTVKPLPQRPNIRRLTIFARTADGQVLAPGPVLDYARKSPSQTGRLDRDAPPPGPQLQVPKDNTGKGKPSETLTFDENAQKGQTSGLMRNLLAMREVLAKRQLERAKEAESNKLDESSLLKAKLRQVEKELKASKDKLRMIEAEGEKQLDKAKDIEKRAANLQKEHDKLKVSKQELDALAAKVKASENNDDIKAFNAKAKEHNAKFEKYQQDAKALDNDKKALSARIGELGRDQTREEKKGKDLLLEQSQLESKQQAADADLMQAKADTAAKEAQLRSIQAEMARIDPKVP